MAFSITTTGFREAVAMMKGMAGRASEWGRIAIGVGASEPYAFWIEEGRYAGGRPGRTTAVHYLRRAQQDSMPDVAAAAAQSILPGGLSVDAAVQQVGDRMRARAQSYVTVRSGRLRGSIYSRRGALH